jgi:hypothetical protein
MKHYPDIWVSDRSKDPVIQQLLKHSTDTGSKIFIPLQSSDATWVPAAAYPGHEPASTPLGRSQRIAWYVDALEKAEDYENWHVRMRLEYPGKHKWFYNTHQSPTYAEITIHGSQFRNHANLLSTFVNEPVRLPLIFAPQITQLTQPRKQPNPSTRAVFSASAPSPRSPSCSSPSLTSAPQNS